MEIGGILDTFLTSWSYAHIIRLFSPSRPVCQIQIRRRKSFRFWQKQLEDYDLIFANISAPVSSPFSALNISRTEYYKGVLFFLLFFTYFGPFSQENARNDSKYRWKFSEAIEILASFWHFGRQCVLKNWAPSFNHGNDDKILWKSWMIYCLDLLLPLISVELEVFKFSRFSKFSHVAARRFVRLWSGKR